MLNKLSLIIVVLIVLLSGCDSTKTKTTDKKQVHHIVLFWLKDSGNPAQRQEIIEKSFLLCKIPEVINVSTGEVIPSERKIVDDSFDVGITVSFANKDDMNTYTKHKIHNDFVEEITPLLEKAVVYDYNVNISQ